MDASETKERISFVGAVLTGGYAHRMGRDKALLPVKGIPMATRVAQSMLAAGANEVVVVGGDAELLAGLGLRHVADQTPHEGPLAGIIAALRNASESLVVVTACDMPWIGARQVAGLVEAIGDADVVVSAANGQLQPLHAAWKRTALAELETAFDAGERSVLRAIHQLRHSTVDFGVGEWSIDLDTLDDLFSITPGW